MRTWAREQPPTAQIVVHNVEPDDLTLADPVALPGHDAGVTLSVLPEDVTVSPDATLCRATLRHTVTQSGFELTDAAATVVARVRRAFNTGS